MHDKNKIQFLKSQKTTDKLAESVSSIRKKEKKQLKIYKGIDISQFNTD